MTTTREQIIEALGRDHARVGGSDASTTPGFVVYAGRQEGQRVEYMTGAPNPHASEAELAAERHCKIDAYATTLKAAGFRVERRGPRSQYPYLLASRA